MNLTDLGAAPLVETACTFRKSHPAQIRIVRQNHRVAALVAGVAISKRVPTFVLKRKGHSCQKSETTRNDRAFTA